MNKKSGFTLAEVLVTLMIIGVIAAMTIPSLMQSTAQQEFRAAYKKATSMINQAVTLNYALDGRDATDYNGTAFFDLLTQRLNVMSSDQTNTELYTADGMWFKEAQWVHLIQIVTQTTRQQKATFVQLLTLTLTV